MFVDETWVKTNMTRSRGWCQRGQPLIARIPHGHWKTLTFLAGLRHDRIVAPFVLDGPINGIAFTAWVEQCLASRRAALSATPAPICSSCRPTAPTSIRSR
ncbi:Mobile element protein (plasmid) [Sinorhizobium alkalisoli]|nr:Mobile element protein [Sinorhizobium alkalisoli]